ncbi:DDE-type integrase/transposase/recombinase [Microcella sp.]|uniref:DDE-type integrase/transposase/recombinase n=1 Tax=Microcella sp. TaxID=1913979 RepID=UPI003315FBC3
MVQLRHCHDRPSASFLRSIELHEEELLYVKAAGTWRYVYRAINERGQVIDVYVSRLRDLVAARGFFRGALNAHGEPDEVITDLAVLGRDVGDSTVVRQGDLLA